jgi:hypothetical protein
MISASIPTRSLLSQASAYLHASVLPIALKVSGLINRTPLSCLYQPSPFTLGLMLFSTPMIAGIKNIIFAIIPSHFLGETPIPGKMPTKRKVWNTLALSVSLGLILTLVDFTISRFLGPVTKVLAPLLPAAIFDALPYALGGLQCMLILYYIYTIATCLKRLWLLSKH